MLFYNMKKITVFTTTYNRAYLLPRLYESLQKQTNKNFIWLIIDDGSTDNTREIVLDWMAKSEIVIQYHYKENGGMHTGHNLAYKIIETELNVCVDSDDFMPEDAVQIILETWQAIEDKDNTSGIVGLNVDESGNVIGLKIPKKLERGSYFDLYEKGKAIGDKKFVLNTKLVKKQSMYPEFPGEKLVPLGTLYIKMGEENPFVFVNKVFCIVDYQIDGSSHTIFKQYAQSPRGFAYARKSNNRFIIDATARFKNAVHIGSAALFAKDWRIIIENKRTIINLLVFPLSIILNIYIRIKIKSN